MYLTCFRVVFYFKTSKKSNNGTDVNAGQIPQLLYHLVTPESQAPTRHVDSAKEVYILSREFSRTASKVLIFPSRSISQNFCTNQLKFK